MDTEVQKKFASLEQEIKDLKALLAKEVAQLSKVVDEDNAYVNRHIERHGEEHAEITRKLWAAYARTHPEVMDTLVQCDKVLGISTRPNGTK